MGLTITSEEDRYGTITVLQHFSIDCSQSEDSKLFALCLRNHCDLRSLDTSRLTRLSKRIELFWKIIKIRCYYQSRKFLDVRVSRGSVLSCFNVLMRFYVFENFCLFKLPGFKACSKITRNYCHIEFLRRTTVSICCFVGVLYSLFSSCVLSTNFLVSDLGLRAVKFLNILCASNIDSVRNSNF